MLHMLQLFSTDIYKDVIFVDVQQLEANERDLQYVEPKIKEKIED